MIDEQYEMKLVDRLRSIQNLAERDYIYFLITRIKEEAYNKGISDTVEKQGNNDANS
jgi:hypothetical protein